MSVQELPPPPLRRFSPPDPPPASGYPPQRSLRSLGGETAHFVHWGEKQGSLRSDVGGGRHEQAAQWDLDPVGSVVQLVTELIGRLVQLVCVEHPPQMAFVLRHQQMPVDRVE